LAQFRAALDESSVVLVMHTRISRNKNEWKLKKNQSHFTNIFVFYAGDPMKRLKPASASTVTTIRGGNVLRAKTNLPLVNQSLSYDGPHVGFNLNLMIVNLFEQRHSY
jgi:hypothetical protein